MKQRLLIIAVFLLLGAVVNVAVAWGCAAWIDVIEYYETGAYFGSRRLKQTLPSYPAWVQREIDEREGRTQTGWRVIRLTHARWTDQHGFPALSLASCMYVSPFWHWNGPATVVGARYDLLDDGIPIYGRPATQPRHAFRVRILGPAQLPLRPIWPGFAINTLFYATLLWVLIPGPFALRRFLRLQQGFCPKCAYPMGESSVCSECGESLLPDRALRG